MPEDIQTTGLYNTDADIERGIAGEPHPRVKITPQGEILVGMGQAPPEPLVADPQRASSTGATTAGAGATIDRSGLVVTFTVGAVPWVVEAREVFLYATVPGALPALLLRDNANTITARSLGLVSSTLIYSTHYGSVPPVVERITVPGTYTRKVSVSNIGTGSITFGGGGAEYVATILARPER